MTRMFMSLNMQQNKSPLYMVNNTYDAQMNIPTLNDFASLFETTNKYGIIISIKIIIIPPKRVKSVINIII